MSKIPRDEFFVSFFAEKKEKRGRGLSDNKTVEEKTSF